MLLTRRANDKAPVPAIFAILALCRMACAAHLARNQRLASASRVENRRRKDAGK